MSNDHGPDTGDFAGFAEFADSMRGQRQQSERIVRQALERAGARRPLDSDLTNASTELDGTFRSLEIAAEELRVQNEALFAARVELEGTSALFRELFELAPVPYLVTDVDTRVRYANEAACALLECSKNMIGGKLLVCFVAPDERRAFDTAVLRTRDTNAVCTWPTRLSPRGRNGTVYCRMRVRPASASGTQPPLALYWNITEETDEDLF